MKNIEIDLMRDKPFKMIFTNPVIFEDFIKSVYDFFDIHENLKIYNLNSQVLIPADNIIIKDFYSDVVGITDRRIIVLEAYGKYRIFEEKKSFSYASRLYGNQLFEKGSYDDVKKVLCINIISGKSFKKSLKAIECFKMADGIEVMDCDPIIFINIFLDNIKFLEYTLSKQRLYKYLKILCCSYLDEVRKIVKGDEVMNNTIKFINKFYSTPGNTREDRIESDKEDIKRYWNQVGEEKGIKVGEENQLKDTISRLYSKNFTIDKISSLLDISKEEVRKYLML